MNDTIVLPNDKDMERCVLGSILSNDCYYNVQDVLTDECFYQEKHKVI